ncbi:MAG TPA: hypothetical protein VFE19_07785 [Jatrophihabitantaceae bacterium]|jgi:hypothetical protein|nr:hypothetical protein [Jatrophihabitantaceae bacterium]
MSSKSVRVAFVAVFVAVVGLGLSVPGSALASAHTGSHASVQRANQFKAFLRGWYGHDRILHITKKGVAHESFLTGCCPPESRYTLKLSNVHVNAQGHPVAHLRVTAIHIDHGGYRFPGVHVGSTGRAEIKGHVYRDSVLKSTFCDGHAPAGTCGA